MRAVEELVRGDGSLHIVSEVVEVTSPPATGTTKGTTSSGGGRESGTKTLPEPGVLELEELLSTYLNTRVKVDIQNRRGRLVVEFATLEDLERIYRAMVGDGGA